MSTYMYHCKGRFALEESGGETNVTGLLVYNSLQYTLNLFMESLQLINATPSRKADIHRGPYHWYSPLTTASLIELTTASYSALCQNLFNSSINIILLRKAEGHRGLYYWCRPLITASQPGRADNSLMQCTVY